MTQSIEDRDQSEYVRGIQAGRRIERQFYVTLRIRSAVLYFALGVCCGWLLF